MMNITNVNSGENGGLKRLLQHLVRIATWIGCGNQKVALCFKHLHNKFKCVADFDAALLALWKEVFPLPTHCFEFFGKCIRKFW